MRSLPPPPSTASTPDPAWISSSPPLPKISSSPPPLQIVSRPPPPWIVSSKLPVRISVGIFTLRLMSMSSPPALRSSAPLGFPEPRAMSISARPRASVVGSGTHPPPPPVGPHDAYAVAGDPGGPPDDHHVAGRPLAVDPEALRRAGAADDQRVV